MSYRCVLIDDDEMDRLMLSSIVRKFPQLHIIGVFESAEELLQFDTKKIDVLLLDIDMPGMSGLELRKILMDVPVCVYISSHPEFAIESFSLETLDFITKPLLTERFAQTYNRILEYMEIKEKAQLYEASIGGETITIKEGHMQSKIKLHEIQYLEALKDYTKIITPHKKHLVLSNLGTLLKDIHFQSFVRIHRSYAVQKNSIAKVGATQLELLNKTQLPIGKNYKSNLNFMFETWSIFSP